MTLLRATLLLSSLVLTLVLCGCLPQPRHRVFRLLGLLAILAFGVEVTGTLTTLQHINNSVLYNIFTLVEFLLVLLMVRAHAPQWSNALLAGAAVGIAAMAWNSKVNPPMEFMLIEGILVIAFISTCFLLAVLWDMARTSLHPLHRVPTFWLYMGLLVYFGGLVPVVGITRYVFTADQLLANRLWSIVPVLCILRYLLAAVACYLEGRAARSAHG